MELQGVLGQMIVGYGLAHTAATRREEKLAVDATVQAIFFAQLSK